MLLAKVLDRLFNRRNAYEIESLEGDIDINDISLKEVTDWVKEMFTLIYRNQDGKIILDDITEFEDDVFFTAYLCINNLNQIVDSSDNLPLFPLENNAGKVLAVNEDENGLVAVDVNGGTQLYKHEIVLSTTPYTFSLIIFTDVSNSFTFNDLLLIINGLYGAGVNHFSKIYQKNALYEVKCWKNGDGNFEIHKVEYSVNTDNELVATLSSPHPAGTIFSSIVSDTVTPL